MKRQKAFKFRLEPNGAQRKQMARTAGCCRFVYNRMLAEHNAAYALDSASPEAKMSYAHFCKQATAWKQQPELDWLKQVHSQPIQQAVKNLSDAFVRFFKGQDDYPTFKKKQNGDSFRYPQGVKLDEPNERVFLPKIGWVPYRRSQLVQGEIGSVTVSRQHNHWFVSIQTAREVEPPRHPNPESVIGIDMGVARFATLSDGSHYDPLNSFKKHEQRLKRYQRRMARKVKFSNNWKKAKAKVTQVHIDIGNARKDYLHKITSTLSKIHAVVCIEDLQVGNMSRSAAGSLASPGRNVRAKSGLNKAILDQGWGEFRRQLEYKLAWRGGMLVPVPPQYTSQTCPACGHVSRENRKTQAKFACVECGYTNHADVVGAINVLERGQRLIACGEVVLSGPSIAERRIPSHAEKQEPAEVSQAFA